MLKLLLFIFISFIVNTGAFDFKGKWEIDLEESKSYAKKIGADFPADLKTPTFEISDHSILINNKAIPLSKFKVEKSECQIFYIKETPLLLSQHHEGIRLLNWKSYPPLILKKSGKHKEVNDTIKGLEGRWAVNVKTLMKIMPREVVGMINKDDLELINKIDFIEFEFFKNNVNVYICDFPFPVSAFLNKVEVHKNSENEFKITKFSLSDDEPNEISMTGFLISE